MMSAKQFVVLYGICVCLIVWSIGYIAATCGAPFEKWWIYPLMLTDVTLIVIVGVFIGSRLEKKN